MRFRNRQSASGADFPDTHDAQALVMQARVLSERRAAPTPLMEGRQLALLSPDRADETAHAFVQAATGLGAHVSFVQAGLDERSSARQVEATARMLGQLYDAVECQHLPLALVRRLARSAGIPVFAGLATPAHPTAALAAELTDGAPWPERRRRILQAALLASMA